MIPKSPIAAKLEQMAGDLLERNKARSRETIAQHIVAEAELAKDLRRTIQRLMWALLTADTALRRGIDPDVSIAEILANLDPDIEELIK